MATFDTGAQITALSQSFAVQHGLQKVDAALPRLQWIGKQQTVCYGAYWLPVRLTDDAGESREHRILAYGVDKDGPELLLGRYTLRTLGIDISNGTDTWRYGRILTHSKIERISFKNLKREIKTTDVPVHFVGMLRLYVDLGGQAAIRIQQLEPVELKVPDALEQYTDMFDSDSAKALPANKATDHAINVVEGKEPPYGPLYSLSQRELGILQEYLQAELENGRITHSTSPAGAPIIFVPKKDGTLRLCVDYRALNSVTIKDRCPLPLINETLDRLVGAHYFTTLDLKEAYHRIRIRAGDEWKTAFRTRYGHFEYKVMPFGLTNAPATFQAYVNRALAGLLDDLCVVYLDDILIYTHSADIDDHWAAVRRVLDRLRVAELFVSLKKCTFASSEVAYLGFIINRTGVMADPAKVATIVDWPVPENIKEVQSFLGFANFYRRFVEGYSKVVSPLTDLMKGEQIFAWGPPAQRAFELLKEKFTTAPVMRHFDPSRQLKLETDASDFGLSGILSQKFEDDKWHPIAFTSRKMQQAERNWQTYDQELLAIVHSFKTWRQYVDGAAYPVQVYTDHNNLTGIKTVQRLNPRQARWAVFLGSFDFEIHHRSGVSNPADGPSRRADYVTENEAVNGLLPTLQNKLKLADGAGLTQAVRVSYARVVTESGTRGTTPEDFSEESVAGGQPATNTRNISPVAGTAECMQLVPRSLARMLLMSATASADVEEPFVNLVASLQLQDPFVLQRRDKADNTRRRTRGDIHDWMFDEKGLLRHRGRLYVPNDKALRTEVISTHHDSKLAGHFGVDKTYELIHRSLYWPELLSDIKVHVSTCAVCQQIKSPRRLPFGKLSPLPIPKAIWEEVSLDFIVKLPPSKANGVVYDSILVIVDRLSKMALYIPASEKWTARDFADCFFRCVVSKYGMPLGIVSDRGTLFTSAFWTELCFQAQMKRRLSTAYHPQTDGQTERQNQTLEAYLRAFTGDTQDDWASLLPLAEFAYNNSEHTSTGVSPFFMVMGKNPRWTEMQEDLHHEGEAPAGVKRFEQLQNVREKAADRLKKAQESQQRHHAKTHISPAFRKGDQVLLSTKNLKLRQPSKKMSSLFIGPFLIDEAVGTSGQAFRLHLPPTYRIHNVFHASLLKPYHHRPGEPQANVSAPELSPDGNEVWEVERIVGERTRGGEKEYCLRWKNYDEDWDTWEPEENFEDMGEAVAEWQGSLRKKKQRNRKR